MRRVALLLLALASAISPADTTTKEEACGPNMFQCPKAQCIPTTWRCDGDSDCPDGEDEKECDGQSKRLCHEGEYMCKPSSDSSPLGRFRSTIFAYHCIPAQWKCDGKFDCASGDDEEGCTAVKCRDGRRFMCTHTTASTSTLLSCIPNRWLCDGQADCIDRSDEEGCYVENECGMNEFRCADGQCIYRPWRCDGANDCTDGSDESNCRDHECDNNTKFQCKTSHICITQKWRCDGEPDCPDHSDELDCPSVQPVRNITCAFDEFKCKTGSRCINKDWVCDSEFDCPDESDEHSCDAVLCKGDENRCKSGACRPKSDFCNGIDDCGDGSDEEECSATTVPLVKSPDTCDNYTEYTCPGTPLQCIKYSLLCLEDQAAGHCSSDANVCYEDLHACEPGTDYCVCADRRLTNKRKGEICACRAGFKTVNKRCVDIDECVTPGVCDQKCTNTAGGYVCTCYPGYKLTVDMKSTDGGPVIPSKCRALDGHPLLLLSNRAAIRQYDLNTKRYHPLTNKLESAVAVDYWYKDLTIVWSDVTKEQIVICRISEIEGFLRTVGDCSEDSPHVTVISKDMSTPDDLAVDWIHGLLFWTDSGLDRISVINLSNLRRRVLFDKDLDQPRAIAVDPVLGLVFWSDWGHHARIERAGMDGEHRVKILSGDQIRWPNCLALDVLEQRLYWADAKMKLISSSDYWGRNIRTVLRSASYLSHPFSIAVFEEKVYWTDWSHDGVLTANKFNGEEPRVIVRGVTGPVAVRVYQHQAQPEHDDKCFKHKCEHICLPKPRIRYQDPSQEEDIKGLQYSCACENGFNLSNFMKCTADTDVTHPVPKDLSGGYGFPILLILIALVVLFVVGTAFVWYRRRAERPSSSYRFRNPIYRRTVEDLDTDMDGVPGTSLHLQPSCVASQPASRVV